MSGANKSLDELILDLRSKDVSTRTAARQAVVAHGAAAVSSVLALLRCPEQHVRWEAAKTLQALAQPAAAASLVEALADADGDVSWVAAEALVAIGQPSVKPLLERLVRKPLPNQSPSDMIYRGAHHVLHAVAKETGDSRFARLLKALGGGDAEMSVPGAAEAVLHDLR